MYLELFNLQLNKAERHHVSRLTCTSCKQRCTISFNPTDEEKIAGVTVPQIAKRLQCMLDQLQGQTCQVRLADEKQEGAE